MRSIVAFTFWLLMATTSRGGELPHPSLCDSRPVDKSRVAAVAALPEFVKKAHEISPLKLAFNLDDIGSAEISSRCGTTIAVYVDHPDRLEMWQIFFVDGESHAVTYVTGDDATFIKLGAWRAARQ